MKLAFAIAPLLLALAPTLARAADPVPLALDPGEWEYTVSMHMSGMPQITMPQIPEAQLARLPPDQRAKMEAMMQKSADVMAGKPTTNRSCMKKADLMSPNPMGQVGKRCKTTVIDSSSVKVDFKIECGSGDNVSSSTISLEALGPQASKFHVDSSGSTGGRKRDMSIDGTGKWIAADCTQGN